MKYLVLVRPVNAHILGCAVISYLVVESSQLRHLDEIAEAFFLDNPVGDIELKVGGFLCENRQPCVYAANILPLKLFRSEIFEEQI